MTSVALMRSPATIPSYSFGSSAEYGIVIADMKPGISSCRMTACLWSACIERTCPCSLYSLRSPEAPPPHAAESRESTRKEAMLMRMALV